MILVVGVVVEMSGSLVMISMCIVLRGRQVNIYIIQHKPTLSPKEVSSKNRQVIVH